MRCARVASMTATRRDYDARASGETRDALTNERYTRRRTNLWGIFLSRGCDWSVGRVYSYRGAVTGPAAGYIPMLGADTEALACLGAA
eukprot:1187726-Prorocentrum_minimum.AAC.2